MKTRTKMTFRLRPLAALTGGMLLGMVAVGPVIAATVTESTTDTVIGHKPVLADNGVVTATDTDASGAGGNPDGVLGAGDTLKVTGFDFSDVDGDTPEATTYEWLADGQAITGATTDSYTLQPGDMGKKITVRATPHTDAALTDPAEGDAVVAKDYKDFSNNPVPGGLPVVGVVVSRVTINGLTGTTPVVDTELAAVVECSDGTATATCNTGKLAYQWQVDDGNGGTYTDIAGATSDKYKVQATDQKRHIRVNVTDTP